MDIVIAKTSPVAARQKDSNLTSQFLPSLARKDVSGYVPEELLVRPR